MCSKIPDDVRETLIKAKQCRDDGDLVHAEELYRKAIDQHPHSPNPFNNLAAVIVQQGRTEEAVPFFQKAIELKPDFAAAHSNLASSYKTLERFGEALDHARFALEADPELADAYNNMGATMFELCYYEEAQGFYQIGLGKNPALAAMHTNYALLLMTLEKYELGWKHYEWRAGIQREMPRPLWRGEDLQGKTILLWTEQGLGDSIQFIRLAKLLKELGANIILECQAPLCSLMQEIEWVDRAVEQTGQVPPFHVHCPLLSLGERFNVRLDRNPVETPYLSVDQDRIGHWRSLIEHTASDTRLRVGFTWAGNPKHLNDKNRSTTLENFVDLTLAHPDIQFYSVQKPTDEQRIQLADQPAIVDLGGEFNDFSDTAAALSSLDLVIGVDSAVIHLAGGLARPCWALLPYRSDWRWLLERSDSPWYPNMRLFRQPERKDWQSVFREVERELANYVQTTKLKH